MRATSTRVTGGGQPTLLRRVLSAIRRNGGMLLNVPDNFAGMFEESTGITPVDALGDVIGLITDRSYGSSNLGAELVANGDFAAGSTGWTLDAGISVSGGALIFNTADATPFAYNSGTVVAGKTYEARFTMSGFASGGVSFANNGASVGSVFSANGVCRQVFVATQSGALAVRVRVSATVATIDNISVREVLGNHATRPTPANKPVVGRVPNRTQGPVNQLLWSGDFTNAVWVKQQLTVATNATPAPDGGTCFKLTEDTATALHRIEQNWTATAGATYTIAVIVRAAERTWARLFEDSGGGAAWVNLTDGSLGTVSNGTAASAHLGNGWYLLALTYTQTGTTLRFRLNTATANNIGSYAGDGTSGILLHRAALFTGTVTAQQIIDNGGIPLTTTQPLPNVLSWTNAISFDGTNDFLSTGITTGNEGWVCAGVTFGGAAGVNETIFANGAGSATLRGIWLFRNGVTTASAMRMGIGNGTALTMPTYSALTLLNTPRVVEGGWTASSVFVAVDGNEAARSRTGDATPAPNATIIGSYTAGANPLTGPMTALVYTPVLPSAADRALIRRWIGSLQGQTL